MNNNLDIFGNLKNIRTELNFKPKLNETQLVEDYDEEQCLEIFRNIETKGKRNLPNKKNYGLKKKKNDKKTNKKETKNKEIAGKLEPVKDQTSNENDELLDKLLQENAPISKRLRSSIGKVDAPTSIDTEVSKAKATKVNRRRAASETKSKAPPMKQRKKGVQHAADAAISDVIDLTEIEQQYLGGCITLDSDDELPSTNSNQIVENEDAGIVNPSNDLNLDTSFDADNPEVSIKIRWNNTYLKYPLRKYQKFSHIMQQIAEHENVPVEDIVLNLESKFVKPSDTPDSIGYKVFNFIDGRARKLSNPESNEFITTNIRKKESKGFHLKVQSGQMKHPLVVKLKKTDPLKMLFIKCAEELDLQISQIKLSIDGELITINDTAEQLDLDGGEIVEMYIKN